MAYVKKWNGSAWVDASVKKWNGSSWVTGLVKKYNGSAWVQIYPDTDVSTTTSISAYAPGMQNYRTTWSNWGNTGEARQGNGSNYSGSAAYYGYLNMNAAAWTGSGSITGVSSASFTGKRGGAGSYNSNQTIKFYRSNVTPSSSPVNTIDGNFTCSTNAPGSGGTMSNKAISNLTNFMNWMNRVNGKNYAYIYSNATSDYLNVTSASFKATYTYRASTYTFEGMDEVSTYNLNKVIRPSEAYHEMLVYDNEKDMTLREIIQHRTENNIPDIHFEDTLDEIIYNPYTTEYKVEDGKVYMTFHRLVDGDIPEFTVDGVTYSSFNPGTDIDKYEGILPESFDKNRHTVHVRVHNIITDEIRFELDIEPLILLV